MNLTSAPGPGLCYLLRSSEIFRYLLRSDIDWTLTGPEPDLDRSMTIKGPLLIILIKRDLANCVFTFFVYNICVF